MFFECHSNYCFARNVGTVLSIHGSLIQYFFCPSPKKNSTKNPWRVGKLKQNEFGREMQKKSADFMGELLLPYPEL